MLFVGGDVLRVQRSDLEKVDGNAALVSPAEPLGILSTRVRRQVSADEVRGAPTKRRVCSNSSMSIVLYRSSMACSRRQFSVSENCFRASCGLNRRARRKRLHVERGRLAPAAGSGTTQNYTELHRTTQHYTCRDPRPIIECHGRRGRRVGSDNIQHSLVVMAGFDIARWVRRRIVAVLATQVLEDIELLLLVVRQMAIVGSGILETLRPREVGHGVQA